MRTPLPAFVSDSARSRRDSGASRRSSIGSSEPSSSPPSATSYRSISVAADPPDGPAWEWRWLLGVALAVGAFVAAGLYIATHDEKAADERDLNRAALTTVCSTMTVLAIVYEQLKILDSEIARDRSLAPSVRERVRRRGALYATAVEALNETNVDCEQIE